MSVVLVHFFAIYSALTFFFIFFIHYFVYSKKIESLHYSFFFLTIALIIIAQYLLDFHDLTKIENLFWLKFQHVAGLCCLVFFTYVWRNLTDLKYNRHYLFFILSISSILILLTVATSLIVSDGIIIKDIGRIENRTGVLFIIFAVWMIGVLGYEFFSLVKQAFSSPRYRKEMTCLLFGITIIILSVLYDILDSYLNYHDFIGINSLLPIGTFFLTIFTGVAFIGKYFQVLSELQVSEAQIKKMLGKSRYEAFELIELIASTLEAKDQYTAGHSQRVTQYALEIAEQMGLSSEDRQMLKTACLLHDIGKIGVSEAILNKPDKLTDEEFAEIKKHPVIGVEILSHYHYFVKILPLIYYHHERIDGRGYPQGERGNNIPLLSRIISVADTFDAVTSDRPYRKAASLEQAVQILISAKGTQLDNEIVELFLLSITRQLKN